MKTKTLTIPKTLFRTATFDREAINEEARTVELSISSDAPYERFFGNEILDHKAASVRLERLKKSAPLLFNHDRDKHLGRITKVSNDGVSLRITAKFSKSAFAEEKWQDVKDGILRESSVGYVVNRMVLESEDNERGDTYRVTDWEPMEGSLVTIPADITTGVGRSADGTGEVEIEVSSENTIDSATNQTQTRNQSLPLMPEIASTQTSETSKPTIDVSKERNEAVTNERKRVADIQELNQHFSEKGIAGRKVDSSKIAAEMIREGKTVQDFQNAVIRAELPEIKPVATKEASEGMSDRDISKYSLLRAINSVIGATQGRKFDGLEREMSDEVAKRHDRPASSLGFFIPHDVMSRSGNLALTPQQRTLFATGSFTAAGALVPIGAQGQSMIDLYRNKMHVVAMGAQVLGGLQGTLAIPRQTGGATAAWLAEDATITASNQAVGQLTLTPHRLAAATAFSTQLLAQASPDIENFVRNDLMAVLAIEKDRAALLGSGSAGEPLGIYNTPNIATTVDITATSSITYAEAVQFETNVAAGNADLGSLGYITSVYIRGTARVTPKFSNTATPLWDGDMLGSYPARATNQLTATPSVIFGNWNDMIIGDWVAPEIIVDPYSLSMANQIRIVVHQLTDIGIRHPKSFCFGVV